MVWMDSSSLSSYIHSSYCLEYLYDLYWMKKGVVLFVLDMMDVATLEAGAMDSGNYDCPFHDKDNWH